MSTTGILIKRINICIDDHKISEDNPHGSLRGSMDFESTDNDEMTTDIQIHLLEKLVKYGLIIDEDENGKVTYCSFQF